MNTTFSHNTYVRGDDVDDVVNRLLEHDTVFEDDIFGYSEDEQVRDLGIRLPGFVTDELAMTSSHIISCFLYRFFVDAVSFPFRWLLGRDT
jgi:hypothetical protein